MNRKPHYGEITNAARDAILETCRRIDCQTDSPVALEKFREIHQTETEVQKLFNPYITQDQIQRRMKKVHELKRVLLDTAGLGQHVEPTNDGTFQNDVLLTDDQVESLIRRLNVAGRKKRSAIYAEQMPTNVWEHGQSIPVAFDNSLCKFIFFFYNV